MSERVQDCYDESDFQSLLDTAEANAANDWEVSFVSDLISNFEAYGRRMFISDSQKSHLERIANDE